MNNLFRLLSRIRVLLLFILLEAVAFILLANTSFYQKATVYQGIRIAKTKVDGKLSSWKYYFSLKETNDRLAQENTELTNLLAQYQTAITADSLQVITILDTLSKPIYSYVPAMVTTNSTSNLYNSITLNVGSKHGVAEGMGVVVSNGLVGMIVMTNEHYSLAKSLLNVDWRISAKLATNGAFGSMYWDGKDYRKLLLTEIPQHTSVNVGDTIVSSGYSAIFPPDIPIGTVASYEVKRGNFYEITVDLFLDFKQLYHVKVVNHLYKEEITTLEAQVK